ncbi:MAG: amidohydrolase family protein [Phycisphaerales bacterium JB050]
MRVTTAITAALVALCGSAAALADRVVLIPSQMVAPNGSLVSGKAVVVEGGTIVRIGDASAFEGDRDALRVDGVLSPGLIMVGSTLGVDDADSGTRSVMAEVRVADGYDPNDPDLERAAKSGVTGAMVIPLPTNVVSGATAFITTHASDGAWFIEDDGPMMFSFGPPVYDLELGPTSRSGALVLLREALEDAKNGDGPLREVLDGERGAVAYCPAIDDVDAAFRVFDRYRVEAKIMHDEEPRLLAEALESTPTPVAMGPFTFSTPSWRIAGAGMVAEGGSPVVLMGEDGSDPGRSLRVSASLAVRYGMDAADARRAMTSAAAEYAGVGERVGSIERGQRADLVVFSDDPLRLDASVQWVMIGGEWVVKPGASAPADEEFDFSTTMPETMHGSEAR